MKKYSGFVYAVGTIFLAACAVTASPEAPIGAIGQTVSVPGGEYTNISPDELQTKLENKDFLFINVHIPFEGDIPNTDITIPFDEIEENIDQLPADKNAEIVLYCRSGNMSDQAARTMVELGFTNVWNLEGGFKAWKQAGLPMEGE